MKSITITKKDILRSVYFITALTQHESGPSMIGALSSKSDLMGGIFDRWMNTVPESIVFNKIILPEIETSKRVEVISDYYLYNVKKAGINTDLIGLKVDNKTIPFVVFKDRWIPVPNAPQVEIKTFKKPQKMVSLRNQGYDDEYLVLVESEYRIDYLLPLLDEDIFSDEVLATLSMDDEAFIISDIEGCLSQIDKVSTENKNIGTITLLKVTTAEDFMKTATFCESRVSVQRINNIEKKPNRPNGTKEENLINYCNQTAFGLYRFNEMWYDGVTEDGIPFYKKGSNRMLCRALDFYTNDINNLKLLKKSKSSFYLEATNESVFNEFTLEKGGIYRFEMQSLDRSSNEGTEYFLQKSIIKNIPDHYNDLLRELSVVVENESVNNN